ncbi:uncharacterized protein [Amphiura filiformis]|uniref:uncharacterized protein n=1 Tax=Amphiura filiformis TaxID=82378 RepID=UPI003B215797
MVKTRTSMETQTIVEVTEPKVGDLPDEKSSAALPDEDVPKMQETEMKQAQEPVMDEEKKEPVTEPKPELKEEQNTPNPTEEITEGQNMPNTTEENIAPSDNDVTEKTSPSQEQVEEEQGTKRPADETQANDEEAIAAKKLKVMESGDQEVPAKKIMCEE